VEPSRPLKSVGHEETFGVDLHVHEPLRRHAVRMSDSVAGRLRSAGVAGRTVVVKVRFGDFTTITRSRTLPQPTTSAPTIAEVAGALLDQLEVGPGVRLLGVSVTGLSPMESAVVEQLSFREVGDGAADAVERRSTQREVDGAVDAVRRRFGEAAVRPASVSPPADDPARPAGGRRVPEGTQRGS
jgi:DNA polymerase-4